MWNRIENGKPVLPKPAAPQLSLRYFLDGKLREWQPIANLRYERRPPDFAAFVRMHKQVPLASGAMPHAPFDFVSTRWVPAVTIVFANARRMRIEDAIEDQFLKPHIIAQAIGRGILAPDQTVVMIKVDTRHSGSFLVAIPGPTSSSEVHLKRRATKKYMKKYLLPHDIVQFV